jgi:hypothetical protein
MHFENGDVGVMKRTYALFIPANYNTEHEGQRKVSEETREARRVSNQ